jgi:hypothetical protein
MALRYICFTLVDHGPTAITFLTVPLTSYGIYNYVETNLEDVNHATGLQLQVGRLQFRQQSDEEPLAKKVFHRSEHQWIILF